MKQVFTYWSFDLSSLITVVIVISLILIAKNSFKKYVLATAILLLLICVFSPLHVLSMHYLFSAHMIVHVILLLCVSPLFVMSLSENSEKLNRVFLFLKNHPAVGWLSAIGVMWFWHLPLIFNSAMTSMDPSSFNFISTAESTSLIVAGVLFSAPLIHPNKQYRIDELSGVVYLFTACIGCSLLGLLITFAPTGMYHHFLSRHDQYGLNKIILKWGITQANDQEAAGLIMWVPCCLIYVTGAMYLLVQWFKRKEEAIVFQK